MSAAATFAEARWRMGGGRVAIVLVNWRGWRDTLECLESLFRLDLREARVIVCDNASGDGSLVALERWAQGSLAAEPSARAMSAYSTPPVRKPVPCVHLREDESDSLPGPEPLVLIEARENRGFAAGCNIGIRHALHDPQCEYIWLLNNDTVVDGQALASAIGMMEREELTMCGSVCRFYYKPEEVQILGGLNYNRWTGQVKPRFHLLWPEIDALAAPEAVDFINGASWFIRRQAFERVGLLNESYFLYNEEMDFALRLDGRGCWSYSTRSHVYHKAGASAGSSRARLARSALAEFYAIRGRVLLCRLYFPLCLSVTLPAIALAIVHRLLCRRWETAAAMLRGLWAGLRAVPEVPPRLARVRQKAMEKA
jgi:hypothetical protein